MGPYSKNSHNLSLYLPHKTLTQFFFYASVAWAVGPSVNPLQNRETQHVKIVLWCMYPFFWPNMKGNHAWKAFKCCYILNWFFLPKTGFSKFIWIFSGRNHLKNQYLSHSESKSYQINITKSGSSGSFQQHQRPVPIPSKISAMI